MMEAHEAAVDERARFAGARAEFVASLGRRLNALRAALRAVEQDPASEARTDHLHRRLHAMGASARVLGFDSIADALGHAEQGLQRGSTSIPPQSGALAEVSRALDLLPTLVWGSPRSVMPSATAEQGADETAVHAWPLSVLVFGAPPVVQALDSGGDLKVECERTEDLGQARELARVLGPDVAVIDGDRRGGRELVHTMMHDQLVDPVPIIVIGTFDEPEAASRFVTLGVSRILPKPVSPDTLRRTVQEVSQRGLVTRPEYEPIGEVTVSALADRIATEVKRGLVEALEPSGQANLVELGQGAEVLGVVWGAVARVRELVTLRSQGQIRFDPGGPEGAVPLAPWMGAATDAARRKQHAERDVEGVTLAGRTIVVADDDPAVVWFISGLLRAVGAEVLETHDGKSALELTRASWPDVVVSDILMPELDGFALCHEIKQDVAVRDVPVILLSWKEDLLQRLRELGADADGYLRKEASASQIVQRVREVLRPRARVEARLAAGGTVRGRLDGLTPRLILELSCVKRKNARVSIRDAAFLYEVECRDGAPRSATRTADDGTYQRGELVIGALLGVSAGRFVVARSDGPCPTELHGSLEAVLSGAIARARAAQRALSSDSLGAVERVELDEAALADYLASTPELASRLVRRMGEGAAPRELLLEGTPRRLLDHVLTDIAQHGGVRRIHGSDGSVLDLTAIQSEPMKLDKARAAARPATPEPPPLFTFQLSPGPPEVDEDPAQNAADEPERSPLPLSREVTPAPPPLTSSSWPQEASTLRGMGKPAVEALTATVPSDPSDAGPASGSLDLASAVADTVTLSPEPGDAPSPSPTSLPEVRKVAEPPRPSPRGSGVEAPAAAEGEGTPGHSGQRDEPVSTEPSPSASLIEREPDTPPLPPAKKIDFPRTASTVPPARRAKRFSLAPKAEQPLGALRVGLLILGSFLGAFFLVRLLRAPSARRSAPKAAASASAPAPAAAAPSAAPGAPAGDTVKTTEIALPPGVMLGPDKGLLEVETGGPQAIYVDGVFVGRGPLRRIPLNPGQHEVRTKQNGRQRVDRVQVTQGRRTRLPLQSEWK